MLPKFALPAFAALAIFASAAHAASINYLGPSSISGTGNGVVEGVLSLQTKPGDNGQEWGISGWNGSALTFSVNNDSQNKTGTGNSTYQARSISEIKTLTFNNVAINTFQDFLSNFAVLFQVGEGGQGSLTLHQLDFHFYAGNGNDVLIGYYPGPNSTDTLNQTLTGTGQGTSGYQFRLNSATLTPTELANLQAWWNAGTGYFGMDVVAVNAITDAKGEADNFFIANAGPTNITAGPGTPLPAGVTMGSALLGGLGLLKIARRRKVSA